MTAVSDLDTPAVTVDMAIMEDNIRRVQAHLSHELRDVVSDFDIRPRETPSLPMLPPPETGDGEARGESA